MNTDLMSSTCANIIHDSVTMIAVDEPANYYSHIYKHSIVNTATYTDKTGLSMPN